MSLKITQPGSVYPVRTTELGWSQDMQVVRVNRLNIVTLLGKNTFQIEIIARCHN